MVMRPSVYVREVIDADYRTNLFRFISWPDPSFPGYPSGHSTFASAAGGVFIETFGNQTDFTDHTHEGRDEFRGMPRTFSSFTVMINENAYSRIPLGVHVRMDCDEGVRLGYEISDGVNAWRLRE
jgi:membrane-associated phospholipid phosphatase